MKKKLEKLLLACAVVACMAVSGTLFANAEGSTSEIITLDSGAISQKIADITSHRNADAFTAPESPDGYSGYIFAGWYTNEKCTTALGQDVTSATIGEDASAYAKFVPEEILSVRAQVKGTTVYSSEKSDLRLVTTVDSLNYDSVGFDIVFYNGTELRAESNEVYRKLYALDSKGKIMNYTPKNVFHSMSKYFMACNIFDIAKADFGHGFTATPYWITLDGTKVSGVTTTKCVNMGYTPAMVGVTAAKVFDIPTTSHDSCQTADCWYGINCKDDQANYNAQGGCTDGTYYYQALIKGSNTAQDLTNDRVYLRKVNMSSGETEDISDDLTLHHANDITYNPDIKYGTREGLLVVIHNAPVYTRLSFVNPDDLTLVNPDNITDLDGNAMEWAWPTADEQGTYLDYSEASGAQYIKGGTFSINYNSTYKRYVVGRSGGQTFTYLNADLSEVGKVYQPTTKTTNFTTQGNTCDDGYIYFVLHCAKMSSTGADLQYDTHVISVYDWDGNFVTVLQIPTGSIPTSEEVENISIYNNQIYIVAKTSTNVTVYKVSDVTYTEATSNEASIVRGDVTYYYPELELAMMDAEAGETITVLEENVEVSSLMEMVVKDVTLTNEEGVDVTITRSSDYVGTLIANSASNFTIKSNEAGGSLTFDGTGSNRGSSWITNDLDGELQLENITVQNVLANQVGGALSALTGQVTINNCVFKNNQNSTEGGAIYSNATLIVEDSAFELNSASNGGAICNRQETAILTVTNCTFGGTELGNTATGAGGAIYNGGSGTVIVNGDGSEQSVFEGNKANGSNGGGAICIGTGTLTLDGYTLKNNTAEVQGGAIALRGDSKETKISNTVFEENSAVTGNGGAIHNRQQKPTITNATFTNNKALKEGGAIYNDLHDDAGQIILTTTDKATVEALFSGNNAGSGGAIAATCGSVSVNGYTFDSNKANKVVIGTETTTETTTTEDGTETSTEVTTDVYSDALGGAIYNIGTVVITDTSFTSNEASGNGGAIYNGGALTLNGTGENTSVFRENKTLGSAEGGAIYHGGSSLVAIAYTFENNKSAARGGVLCNYGTKPTFTDCKMVGNTSATNGGAIYSGGGNSVYLNVSAEPKLEALMENNSTTNGYGGAVGMGTGHLYVDGYTFKTNEASSTGGAIYVVGADNSAQIVNSVFEGNKAIAENGGAVRNKGAVVTIVNSKFTSNEAKTQGGAIANTDSGKMTISATSTDLGVTKATLATFEGNISNNTEEGYGGGAIYYGSGSMSIDGYAFNNNISKGDAGALCLRNGSTVSNCTFSGNSADRTGGAIWTLVSSKVSNSTFTGNTAVGTTVTETVDEEEITNYIGGGAIQNNGPNTVITGSTFTGNTTEQYGGAIYNTGGVTVTEGTFESNVATGRGGAIFNSGATVTVKDTSFKANDGNQGGAIGHQNNDEAVITIEATGNYPDKTIFDGNITAWNGGAIRSAGGTINVKGYTFVSHEAPNSGAAIYVDGGTILNIEDSRFGSYVDKNGNTISAPNIATANGGAIYGGGESTLTLTGTTDHAIFEGNQSITTKTEGKSGYGGGAICIGSGSLTINGYTFKNNSAVRDGGAITHRGGKLDIDNTSFIENETTTGEGGAIYRNANANFTITIDATNGAKFENNKANAEGKSGGAIYLKTGSMTMSGYAFDGNQANKSGGAIYLPSGVSATIEKTSFTSNTASLGGAIECYASTLTATSCHFKSNIASVDMADETVLEAALVGRGGGAVNLVGNSKATFNGTGTFTSNTATNAWGGAIYTTDAELEISGYTFTGNVANQAGAIMIDHVAEIVTEAVEDNPDTEEDETVEAVYDALCATEIQINDSKFIENESTADGGAIYVNLRNVTLSKTTADAEALFDGNISKEGAGGAIEMSNLGGILKVSNYTFTNNRAATQGGAIHCHGDEATISSCTFGGEGQGNIAGTNGGAFYAGTQCETTFNIAETVLTEARFEGNTATAPTIGGGAICMGSGNLTVEGYTFKNNTSGGTGGAIHHNSAGQTMIINNSVFDTNTAETHGGAIYNKAKNMNVSGSTFTSNNAKVTGAETTNSGGGAIYNATASMQLNNNTFTKNTSGTIGGAVTNYAASPTITDCKFEGNTATTNGGGLYIGGGHTVTLTTGTNSTNAIFNGNGSTGYGGAIGVGSGVLNVTGYTFEKNTATTTGGAIHHAASAGSMTISDSVFNSNESKATGNDGGGAIWNCATLEISNTSFHGNIAASYGGGLHHNTSKTAKIESCKFTNNQSTAKRGGAIYGNNTPTITLTVKEGATVEPLFQGNYGKDGGGAICIGSGDLSVTGYTFEQNTAQRYGGAIRLNNNSSIDVNLTSCIFTANQTTATSGEAKGGAILYDNGTADSGRAFNVTNCKFDGNSSFQGGALWINKGAVVAITGTDTNMAIFTGNQATGTSDITTTFGGAIYTLATSTASNVTGYTFTGNSATLKGGAIYVDSGACMTVNSSKFETNTSKDGGAIYNNAGTLKVLNPTSATTAVFTGNTSTAWGGAIYTTGGTLEVDKYTLSGNKGTYGGAILMFSESTVSNTTFQSNEATAYEGGAIYVNQNATFTDCKFDSNIAKTNGGAICYSGKNTTVNLVGTEGSDMALFTNNIANNTAKGGGAIYLNAGTLNVNGYTFSGNTPQDIYKNGGTLAGDGAYETN